MKRKNFLRILFIMGFGLVIALITIIITMNIIRQVTN
jgi:hypothetical protein